MRIIVPINVHTLTLNVPAPRINVAINVPTPRNDGPIMVLETFWSPKRFGCVLDTIWRPFDDVLETFGERFGDCWTFVGDVLLDGW